MKKCSVDGCNGKYLAKGYCGKHYMQLRKYGRILERSHKDLNEIIEYEDHAEIILYNKRHEEIARALIDLDDLDKIKDLKWHLNHGYARNNKIGSLHRLVMDCPDDMVIDHINHNPLDNRKSNLRICTQQQNLMNLSKKSNNTSGTTGVSWSKVKNKWMSIIVINGKTIFLGYFNNKEDAIESRKQAEIDYFGEYRNNYDEDVN